jgi:hypothetical protein
MDEDEWSVPAMLTGQSQLLMHPDLLLAKQFLNLPIS